MLRSKHFLLLASIFMLSPAVFADNSDGILRDADGRIRLMSRRDAARECAAAGTRLPTARELAEESQSMGADGILELRSVSEAEARRRGYRLIKADARANWFYFSSRGYRPQGDLASVSFWSSSVERNIINDYVFVLNGRLGYVGYVREHDNAVRCVAE